MRSVFLHATPSPGLDLTQAGDALAQRFNNRVAAHTTEVVARYEAMAAKHHPAELTTIHVGRPERGSRAELVQYVCQLLCGASLLPAALPGVVGYVTHGGCTPVHLFRMSEKHNVDTLVVGSRSHQGDWKRWVQPFATLATNYDSQPRDSHCCCYVYVMPYRVFLGSTVTYVVHHATCNVMVAHTKPKKSR